MPPPELLILAALATYRLTLLFSKEAGPGDIFGRLRYWVGVRPDVYSKETATGFLSELILCPYCLSVWIGFCAALLMAIAPLVAFWLFLPFALSGLAVFFFKWAGV